MNKEQPRPEVDVVSVWRRKKNRLVKISRHTGNLDFVIRVAFELRTLNAPLCRAFSFTHWLVLYVLALKRKDYAIPQARVYFLFSVWRMGLDGKTARISGISVRSVKCYLQFLQYLSWQAAKQFRLVQVTSFNYKVKPATMSFAPLFAQLYQTINSKWVSRILSSQCSSFITCTTHAFFFDIICINCVKRIE